MFINCIIYILFKVFYEKYINIGNNELFIETFVEYMRNLNIQINYN